MKSSHSLAALSLIGLLTTAVACAHGWKSDDEPNATIEPKKTAEPTEPPPPDESVTVPKGPSTSPTADAGTGDTTSTPDDSSGQKPDAGPCTTFPPSNACGLTPQCGCPTGDTCDVTDKSTGAVSCVHAGNGARGAPCTATSQCATGFTCVNNACRPYCDTPNVACKSNGYGICAPYVDSSGKAVPNVNVCTLKCDVMNPSSACGSNACYWDLTLNTSDCLPPGTGDEHAACAKTTDCKPGLACVKRPLDGTMECERWCRVGHSGDCGAYQICLDVFDGTGPAGLGLCQ